MGFDMHAFMLYKTTKKEAIEYVRKVTSENRTLSPQALNALADLFDPNIECRGRPQAKTPFDILIGTGKLRAYERHGFLKNLKQGETWETIITEVFKISKSKLHRILYENNWHAIWHNAYLTEVFRLYAAGIIRKPKVLNSMDNAGVEAALTELLIHEEISEAQAHEIRQLVCK